MTSKISYRDFELFQNSANELNLQRKGNQFCDVALKTDCGHVFPVHKNILASSSEFFRGMLESDMIESRQECILVEKTSKEVLETLLDYMYTKTINIEEDEIFIYLERANFFMLKTLKEHLADCLCLLITKENCFKILDFESKTFENEKLRSNCAEYIILHYKELAGSSGISSLSLVQLESLLKFNQDESEYIEGRLLIFEEWIWSDFENRKALFDDLIEFFDFSLFSRTFFEKKLRNNEHFKLFNKFFRKLFLSTEVLNGSEAINFSTKERLFILSPVYIYEYQPNPKNPINVKQFSYLDENSSHLLDFGHTSLKDNKLFFCGGKRTRGDFVKSAAIYDYETNETKMVSPLPCVDTSSISTIYSRDMDTIFICNNNNKDPWNWNCIQIFAFDPTSDKYREITPTLTVPTQGGFYSGISVIDKCIYAINAKDAVFSLDPRTSQTIILKSPSETQNGNTKTVASQDSSGFYAFSDNCVKFFDIRKNNFVLSTNYVLPDSRKVCVKDAIAYDGKFYISSTDGSLYRLDLTKPVNIIEEMRKPIADHNYLTTFNI